MSAKLVSGDHNHLALFDCDGTMVDSQGNICHAMEMAFEVHAVEAPPRTIIRRVVGLSLVQAMAQLLPDADDDFHVLLAESYKTSFQKIRADGAVREPLYEGLPDLLAQLDSAGWVLGVATGKSDRGLIHCLDSHGLRERFVTLQTADRHPSKPHPAMIEQAMTDAGSVPTTTVMIGDTSFDMEMGRNAGTHNIGVDWGYHPPEELKATGAACIVSTMDDLYKQLEATR